jgi:hypothetical protein
MQMPSINNSALAELYSTLGVFSVASIFKSIGQN